jgi:hypothetical protein
MLDVQDLSRCRVQRNSEASGFEMGDDSAGYRGAVSAGTLPVISAARPVVPQRLR